MAKQTGDFKIVGTIEDTCFYKMDEEYYARRKSVLNGKRFWKEKVFEGSRRSCKRFGEGNQLASKVYKMIDEEKRAKKLFCFLKSKAILLLKKEKSVEEAEEVLIDYLVSFGYLEKEEVLHEEDKNILHARLLEKGIEFRYIKDKPGHLSIKTTEWYLHFKKRITYFNNHSIEQLVPV